MVFFVLFYILSLYNKGYIENLLFPFVLNVKNNCIHVWNDIFRWTVPLNYTHKFSWRGARNVKNDLQKVASFAKTTHSRQTVAKGHGRKDGYSYCSRDRTRGLRTRHWPIKNPSYSLLPHKSLSSLIAMVWNQLHHYHHPQHQWSRSATAMCSTTLRRN